MSAADPRVAEILDFWFGEPGSSERGRAREVWFRKDLAFDDTIRTRFGAVVDEAAAGGLAGWDGSDTGALALLVVCDQFPRNLFRGEARAFALDPRALATARALVAAGRDRALAPLERVFVYLPFEHSESIDDQREAVRLLGLLRDDPQAGSYHEWAVKHFEVVQRFGRFPHRNEALGRASTPEEIAFLAQPGSRF
ncbi:MAG: DUF924 domain-containing protein [Burkholderiales bacterium]|nr:MAG: DUF924 domain-containing protein [Burkholderiales bacterium]